MLLLRCNINEDRLIHGLVNKLMGEFNVFNVLHADAVASQLFGCIIAVDLTILFDCRLH